MRPTGEQTQKIKQVDLFEIQRCTEKINRDKLQININDEISVN